jgi:hypothetical protein
VSGGEGTVYRIANDPSRVAKLYHHGRISSGLKEKLQVMLQHPPDEVSRTAEHRSIAWVDGLVFADRSGRDFRGFTMPAVDTTEFLQAHAYYDASDRVRMFGGDFTWRHLVFAAHNLSSAVAAVHEAGHRVGDLRETNLLVSPAALVTLIDCDSFQICDPHTKNSYPTRVATGDYLPPELQNIDFSSQHPDRYDGDLFALAVLVFRFLMLGVHPFQSRGRAVADTPTTEAKIRKGLFAFSGRHRGVEPPGYAPPYAIVPPALQRLFVRAFVDGHADPSARPSASDWAAALQTEGRQLRTCRVNANHRFAHSSRGCPWCKIAPDPFPAAATMGRQIALEGAAGQVPEAARIEQIRAFARVALADGAITDPELAYLRRSGTELGLRTTVIDRVVDDEARRTGGSPARAHNGTTSANGKRWWDPSSLVHPVRALRATRQQRATIKAAAPVIFCCAALGALAPVVAPLAAAVVAMPALAVAGEIGAARRWRDKARTPLWFGVHLHRAIGHAARLFLPIALLGFALASVVPVGWIVRCAGSLATAGLAWFAIARLPHSADPSAAALRAGRDLARTTLVGESGRMRRPAYALWLVCIAATVALAVNLGLWWPLAVR